MIHLADDGPQQLIRFRLCAFAPLR